MAAVQLKITAQPDVPILGCPRCDTALLPNGDLPKGGPAGTRCPLCGWEEPVEIVEVGGEVLLFNPEQQRLDAAETPVYMARGVSVDEDLVLIDIPGLLDDPAFYALQDGVAPVESFGWVGGTGILGDANYRLLLVVRVQGLLEDDLFRVELPANLLLALAQIDEDRTVVLVSQRKGVFFPEAGEVYLEAVQAAGGRPGEAVALDSWVELDDEIG